jgi:hypothetical protein
MDAVSLTENEIYEVIFNAARARGQGPEGARTVNELAEATGKSVKLVRAALLALKKQGRLIPHRVHRERLDGAMGATTAYTVIPREGATP